MTNNTNMTPAIDANAVYAFLGFTNDSVTFAPEGSNVRTDIPLKNILTAHPELIRFAVLHGVFGKLGNVSKGGLSKQLERPATDADLKAARDKIVARWMEGDWNANRTGPRDSLVGDMREAFIAKQVSLGKTVKEADGMIRAMVTRAFGADEKATFPRFLEAVATLKAKAIVPSEYAADADGNGVPTYDSILADLTASAEAAAKELRESRSAAAAEVDIGDVELF